MLFTHCYFSILNQVRVVFVLGPALNFPCCSHIVLVLFWSGKCSFRDQPSTFLVVPELFLFCFDQVCVMFDLGSALKFSCCSRNVLVLSWSSVVCLFWDQPWTFPWSSVVCLFWDQAFQINLVLFGLNLFCLKLFSFQP